FVVHSGERSDGFEAVLPQTTPTDSVERFHEEEGPLARRSRLCRTSRAQGTFAGLGGVGSLRESWTLTADAGANLRCHEHPIAHHDWRGNPDPAQIGFPR